MSEQHSSTAQELDTREPFTPPPAPELDEVLKLARNVEGANATTDTGRHVVVSPADLEALESARIKAVEAGQRQLLS